MTFLFPESISTSTKIQPKEKLFNLQNLHVIRAQNPLVSTRFFIACKLYITMNGRVFITLMLDLSFSKINRPLDFQSLQDSSDDKELYHYPFLFFVSLNWPHSIYQHSAMAPRLSGQTSIFGVVFFVSKSLLGIGRKQETLTIDNFYLNVLKLY